MFRFWRGRDVVWKGISLSQQSPTLGLLQKCFQQGIAGWSGTCVPLAHISSFIDVNFLADTYLQKATTCSPKDRVTLMEDVCLSELFSISKKLEICDKILESLCTAPTVDWQIVLAVSVMREPLYLLYERQSVSSLRFLEYAVGGLAVADEHAGSENVLSVLRLIRYNRKLSWKVVDGLHQAHHVLMRELPWLPPSAGARPLLELVVAMAFRVPHSSAVKPQVVKTCYDSLVPLLDAYTPPESKRKQALMSLVADATVQLRIYDGEFLHSFGDYISRAVHTNMVRGVVDLQYYLFMFSFMNYSAPCLFDEVKHTLDEPGREWGDVNSIHAYILLSWAYVQQGLEPPRSVISRLCWMLRERVENPLADKSLHGYLLLSLLEQLLEVVEGHVPGLRWFVMESLCTRSKDYRLATEIQHWLPGVHVAHFTPAGMVWACCLVDSDTGFLVPWPHGLTPGHVSPSAALPGIPVALLFSTVTDTLRDSSVNNGIVQRKHSLLSQSGWCVVSVPLEEAIVHSGSNALGAFCMEAILTSVAEHRSGS